VAKSQNKIYFTYNGGRVFDLSAPSATPVNASIVASTEGTPAAAATLNQESLTASEYKRRGSASAGRRDFRAAIADFDAAIKLDATDADAFKMRGNARYQSGQLQLALADLDEVLRLKPDQGDTLMTRGMVRLATNDLQGASADFDRAAALAPNDPGTTLEIAQAYLGAMQFEEAVKRYDQWLAKNPKSSRSGSALNGRCWSRAMLGTQLELALDDCNAAVKKLPRLSLVFDSRAMVQLRRGNVDDAIKDYQASLKILNNNAHTLYGLGVAETKKGDTAQGEAHIRQALQISATAGDVFKRVNLAP
jgi:tetratricopeptide (TPR) repeat protein